MAARSKARKRALDILFECEVRGTAPGETLDDRIVANDPPVNAYTVTLIRGFVEHRPTTPWKVWATGSCFRYEEPQEGRYREFWQYGLELIGPEGPSADEKGNIYFAEGPANRIHRLAPDGTVSLFVETRTGADGMRSLSACLGLFGWGVLSAVACSGRQRLHGR
mgnify:CR=1 FL=1